MRRLALLLALLLATFVGRLPAAAGEPVFDAREEQAIRDIVADYLRQNPEIILEAVRILRERQARAESAEVRRTIRQLRDRLERDPNSPVGGNPDGDVTIVEFFDYRCPYCKRVAPTVRELLERDGNIRMVYKEWPILGPDSEFAARAALAARKQGRYLELHERLMGSKRVDEESVMAAARELGLDLERLRADMRAPETEAHLAATMELANRLGITGTPAFVVGEELIPGMASRATLEKLVARAREGAS
ncbi:MAG TPA: DsbA family protein [Rhodospirillales bacterium]|nr:DsbA family protein [Rhodospirillales bacterium]